MVKTGEWISQGWKLVQPDLGMHVVIALIISLISGTGIGGLIVPTLTCGWIFIFLTKMRNPSYTVQIGDLFSKSFEVFVPSLVAGLLIGVFASVGSIACGVGAIVAYALTMFALPLVIDKRLDFWPAIQESYEKTKGEWLAWSIFVLVLGLLNLAGAIVCGIGILVTWPISVAALAIAYQEVFGAARPAAPSMPTPPVPPVTPPTV